MAAQDAAFFLSEAHQCDFCLGNLTVVRFGSHLVTLPTKSRLAQAARHAP
jgi:hypothetical protein